MDLATKLKMVDEEASHALCAVKQVEAFLFLWLDAITPLNEKPYEADRVAGLLTILESARTSLQQVTEGINE